MSIIVLHRSNPLVFPISISRKASESTGASLLMMMRSGIRLPGFLSAAPDKECNELLHLSGFDGLQEFRSFIDKVFGGFEIPEKELLRSCETVKNNPAKMNSASFRVDDDILKKIVYYWNA